MEVHFLPSKNTWANLVHRPQIPRKNLQKQVHTIFNAIKNKGDVAVKHYIKKFDHYKMADLKISSKELTQATQKVPVSLQQAIKKAYQNIYSFHAAQVSSINYHQSQAGVKCWQEHRAIETVGLYIPNGSAPLFSTVLMLGIPAIIAGCTNIVLCSPADEEGNIHPAILYSAQLVGIKNIFKVGGIQAIAAMVFGTESIPAVKKIFGPGNQYVNAAKEAAIQYGVAIDLPAGPSELLVIADDSAPPAYIAADLISQAEHGSDSQVILLTTYASLVEKVLQEINIQQKKLPRSSIIQAALKHSRAIVLASLEACVQWSNLYAPEHLIISTKNSQKLIPYIKNAGSVFLGKYSPEAAGDYASGTNHTLPTGGFAHNYSGISVDSFTKKISFQKLSFQGLKSLAPTIEIMAAEEQLLAHKNAVSIRFKKV